MIRHLFHTLVELNAEVLTCWWESIQIAHCLYAHARWYLYTLGDLDEHRVVFVRSCNQVGTNEVTL